MEPNRRSFLCGLIGNFRSIVTVEILDSRSMALRYTAQQLLNLKQNYRLQKDAYELCHNAGLLRQRRYLHRSVGRVTELKRTLILMILMVLNYMKLEGKVNQMVY